MHLKKNSAQGALEYLLIIGGAVLVSAIVISLLLASSNPVKNTTQSAILDTLCAKFSSSDCPNEDPDGGGACDDGDCEWISGQCIGSPTRDADCFGGGGGSGPSGTEILSCPFPIAAAGDYYLSDNISIGSGSCIDITASGNVTINCQGNSISASGNVISLTVGTDLTLIDCQILGAGAVAKGIYLSGSDNASVSCSSTIIQPGPGWTVGIYIEPISPVGNNKTISNCEIDGGLVGIGVGGSSNAITSCDITNSNTGFVVQSNDNTISNNTILEGSDSGIVIEQGSNNTISGNSVCGATKTIDIQEAVLSQNGPASTGNTCDICNEAYSPNVVCNTQCENSC